MGLAVLPARLKTEMAKLAQCLVNGTDCREDESLVKHAEWADELKEKYKTFDRDTVDSVLEKEIGLVFEKVLEDAGVFKRDEKGKKAFIEFTETI